MAKRWRNKAAPVQEMTAADERAALLAMAAARTDPPTPEYLSLRNAFVVRWLPLVIWVIRRYRPSLLAEDRGEDCIQAGAVGLITAADRFDTAGGLRFCTYATPLIRGEIAACVALSRLIHVPGRHKDQGPDRYADERKAALTFGRGTADEWAVTRVVARSTRTEPDPAETALRLDRAKRLEFGFLTEDAQSYQRSDQHAALKARVALGDPKAVKLMADRLARQRERDKLKRAVRRALRQQPLTERTQSA